MKKFLILFFILAGLTVKAANIKIEKYGEFGGFYQGKLVNFISCSVQGNSSQMLNFWRKNKSNSAIFYIDKPKELDKKIFFVYFIVVVNKT